MSNKNKKKTTNNNPQPRKKVAYKDPTQTWWGQLIIWLLILGTISTIVIGAIIILIQYFS